MSGFLFPAPEVPWLPVLSEDARFPVRRIFCVGRNYADHAAEMGSEVDREAPFYFTKSAHHLALSGGTIPYAAGTVDYHHEVELVVALGPGAGIFGYGVGLDMTRRDLQAAAKERRRPWDTGKDVEGSAVVAPLAKAGDAGEIGTAALGLMVNGEVRQTGRVSDMVWSVGEIVAHLSTLYRLMPGDLIFTGTPAGVGSVRPGDRLVGRIDGLPELSVTVTG
jgi:fumarylpyruvate hydrolase